MEIRSFVAESSFGAGIATGNLTATGPKWNELKDTGKAQCNCHDQTERQSHVCLVCALPALTFTTSLPLSLTYDSTPSFPSTHSTH
jgi:hypothetical protein